MSSIKELLDYLQSDIDLSEKADERVSAIFEYLELELDEFTALVGSSIQNNDDACLAELESWRHPKSSEIATARNIAVDRPFERITDYEKIPDAFHLIHSKLSTIYN